MANSFLLQSWYGNGHPQKEESSFDSEGRKHGAVKEWFSNGQPTSSKMYKHDVLEQGIPKSMVRKWSPQISHTIKQEVHAKWGR